MKIHVITDESGKIIGTAQIPEAAGSGPGGPRIDAGPGGKVHAIELSKELEAERDPEKLHEALAKHVRSA